ncbi:uncharacterized protein LOC117191243 isoform X1 [Drosophila miranda]|uniref:uncharacterized protein LOC117191243 isoform X1 n=1 Tax=Drosophila miranda TaxID=7229 RepID=UPI00143F9DAE|nr:uncharacterized protein LOC117191243 isoform X1 [Drosophila miranda]
MLLASLTAALLTTCGCSVVVLLWRRSAIDDRSLVQTVTMEQHQPVERLQVRLLPAQTAEERAGNIIAHVVVEGHQASLVPYIDEQSCEKVTLRSQLEAAASPAVQQPRLRYYAVGPSTYKLLCPLCRERSEAAVMRAASFCLSLLSCIFPLFWICCVCTWCGCNREWTTKGVYCSQCGGKVGIQRKAK